MTAGPNKNRVFWLCARPVGEGYDKGQAKADVNPEFRCNYFKCVSLHKCLLDCMLMNRRLVDGRATLSVLRTREVHQAVLLQGNAKSRCLMVRARLVIRQRARVRGSQNMLLCIHPCYPHLLCYIAALLLGLYDLFEHCLVDCPCLLSGRCPLQDFACTSALHVQRERQGGSLRSDIGERDRK